VMRLLPNRMRVSIVERTPVAFVRQGSRIGLVDAQGVLLDMPMDAKTSEHYSFPVVTGISAADALSTRAARMKIFERFTSELDGSGEHISQELSEVDLSNPEDVKALVPDHSAEILVHFGEDDFLDRYRRFKEHLSEWRTIYPKLSSVDMRYERQVVLEMPPGSNAPAEPSVNTAGGDSSAVDAADKRSSANSSATDSAAKAKSAAIRGSKEPAPLARSGASAKPSAHTVAQSAIPTKKKSVSKAKPHTAAVKSHPAVVKAPDTTQYHPPQVVHP
jgi:cell division protein FtsQ